DFRVLSRRFPESFRFPHGFRFDMKLSCNCYTAALMPLPTRWKWRRITDFSTGVGSMNKIILTASAAAIALTASAGYAAARDQIQIAGSSTVLPYAKIVAENFGETFSEFKTPVVESGGSSGGLKEFCKGVGENTIDIANASRPIKESEVKACADAGVTEIQEVRIGYDGIVFATDINGPDWALTPQDLYKALAAQVV